MPYDPPHTIAAGELVGIDTMNDEWGGNIAFLANPPIAIASRAATQSITNNTWNLVTFDTEVLDTAGMFTVASGNRFTCVTAGVHTVSFTAVFASNATGLRGFGIAKGVVAGIGAFAEAINSVATAGGHMASITGDVKLAVGETVSCQVFQSSGGALNLTPGVAGQFEPVRASIRWVGLG